MTVFTAYTRTHAHTHVPTKIHTCHLDIFFLSSSRRRDSSSWQLLLEIVVMVCVYVGV